MKRNYAAALSILVGLTATGGPAHAGLRTPQISFGSSTLQGHLDSQGESINVLTQQQDGLVWGASVSGNTTLTIQFDLGGNLGGAELGIAKLDPSGHTVTGLATVFPASADNGWFAVASFRPNDVLIVNLFNHIAQLQTTTTYTGVSRTKFAYYCKYGGNTFYSHEGFNPDGMCHTMTYAGTGENQGCWWQCWEDSMISDYNYANFSDATVFMESLNPTGVSHSTWGKVKARFR